MRQKILAPHYYSQLNDFHSQQYLSMSTILLHMKTYELLLCCLPSEADLQGVESLTFYSEEGAVCIALFYCVVSYSFI